MHQSVIQEKADIKTVVGKLKEPFPRIILKGTLDCLQEIVVTAENQLLFTIPVEEGGLLKATLGLLAVFYVHLFVYPAGLNNFYLYLQSCILQIHDSKKLTISVIALVNKLD